MVKLECVCKSFDDLGVLEDASLTVEEKEKLAIIGPSGSDRSITVRCMNFLEESAAGQVFIDGAELTARDRSDVIRKSIAVVFRQFNLYPHMTVLRSITLVPIKL